MDIINHTNDTENPHSVTAAQVGAYTTTQTDNLLAAKANKATNPTAGNVAKLDASGNVVDSGVASADLITGVTVNGTSVVSNRVAAIDVPESGSGDNAVVVDENELYVDNVTTDIISNGSMPLVIDGGSATSEW